MKPKTPTEVADNMIAIHGSLDRAIVWAELHKSENAGEGQPVRAAYWASVLAVLEQRKKGARP